jgi:hypothetical protein
VAVVLCFASTFLIKFIQTNTWIQCRQLYTFCSRNRFNVRGRDVGYISHTTCHLDSVWVTFCFTLKFDELILEVSEITKCCLVSCTPRTQSSQSSGVTLIYTWVSFSFMRPEMAGLSMLQFGHLTIMAFCLQHNVSRHPRHCITW